MQITSHRETSPGGGLLGKISKSRMIMHDARRFGALICTRGPKISGLFRRNRRVSKSSECSDRVFSDTYRRHVVTGSRRKNQLITEHVDR